MHYYGAYSVRRRSKWRSDGVLHDTRTLSDTQEMTRDDAPSWPQIRACRRRWAKLVRRIFEVDPLTCPRCGGNMKILAFILDHDVIHAILKHLRKTRLDPTRLPEHDDFQERIVGREA